MDFMPEHATRDTVKAFVAVCAKTCKKTPEVYMAETLDNIDNFVGYYDQWNEKQSSRVTA
jgi:hypothetical protein